MPSDRQTKIFQYLAAHEKVDVGRLSDILQVSPSTVRRELTIMEQSDLLVRTHGGVQLRSPILYDSAYEQRAAHQIEAKRKIAAAARRLIRPGSVVGISGGTTCTELARQLRATQDVTIVTNALNIAVELQGRLDRRVMMTGGLLKHDSYELVGNLVVQNLHDVHLDLAVVGVSGIHLDFGFSVADEPEAIAGRAFMSSADATVIVADHSKIGKATFARLCSIAEVDTLVTDDLITPTQAAMFRDVGLQLLIADSVD